MSVHEAVTCLGCGCACDDITVVVDEGRITDARGACPLGAAWFARGQAATGAAASIDDALAAMAARLRAARRPLVLMAPDLTIDAQREAVGLADEARALVDTGASAGVRALTLATQERGRIAATFAEIRRRADLVVWWGCDPDARHPRFRERCVAGTPESGHARLTIAIDIGDRMGPVDAGLRLAITGGQAAAFATAVRATLQDGHAAGGDTPGAGAPAVLAGHLAAAAYAVIVLDADDSFAGLLPGRTGAGDGALEATAALLGLVSTLNDRTRAALLPLRAGGNVNGADAVLTWQAGAPLVVDYATGVPVYAPDAGARERLARGEVDFALVVGRFAGLDPELAAAVSAVPHAIIGPEAAHGDRSAVAMIDTGIAGIHEPGTAVRMDEVPVPLRAPLATANARPVPAVLRALRDRCRR